ncbi:MAG: hypothetical protein QOE20_2823 [Mycobacterium sp.]|jgi:hypothetical protein|nr:hypothetical protein [Mycobacterium sp.]
MNGALWANQFYRHAFRPACLKFTAQVQRNLGTYK